MRFTMLLFMMIMFLAGQSSAQILNSPPPSGTPYGRFWIFNRNNDGGGPCENGATGRLVFFLLNQPVTLDLVACEGLIYVSTFQNGTTGPIDLPFISVEGGPPFGQASIEVIFDNSPIVFSFGPATFIPGAFDNPMPNPTPIARNWAGFDGFRTPIATPGGRAPVLFFGGISGDLTGSFEVDSLHTLRVGGTVLPGVRVRHAATSRFSGYARYQFGSFQGRIENSARIEVLESLGGDIGVDNSSSDVIQTTESISLIQTGGANLFADITTVTPQGRNAVGRIDLANSQGTVLGNIGSGTDAVNIETGTLTALVGANNAFVNVLALAPGAGLAQFRVANVFAGNLNVSNIVQPSLPEPDGLSVRVGGFTDAFITVREATTRPVSFLGGLAAAPRVIDLGTVSSTVSFAGDVPAGSQIVAREVTATGALNVSGSLQGMVRIAGSHAGSVTFGPSNATAGQLSGQVIVNRANTGGTWTGSVRVAGPASTPIPSIPFYTILASQLGNDVTIPPANTNDGGAVGLAPFRLHRSDSWPAALGDFTGVDPPPTNLTQTFWWALSGAASQMLEPLAPGVREPVFRAAVPMHIRSRFYGPIKWNVASSSPQEIGVGVEHWTGSQWVDKTEFFRVQAPLPTTDVLANPVRDILLVPCVAQAQPMDLPPGTYRIFRNEDRFTGRATRLQSAFVDGSPSVAGFVHQFVIGVQCNPADVGQQGGVSGPDGALDNNDFTVFVELFFAQNSSADVGVQGGLIGKDGQFNNNDFVAFTSIQAMGCFPKECPVAFIGSQGDGSGSLEMPLQFGEPPGSDIPEHAASPQLVPAAELSAILERFYNALPADHPHKVTMLNLWLDALINGQ